MTLSFSTQINGKPNYFPQKIWEGLIKNNISTISDYQNYRFGYNDRFGSDWGATGNDIPKLHTIRKDEKNRWGADCDIHFVINNRTPNRFRFAPVIKCKSVQDILITHHPGEIPGTMFHFVYVDGYQLYDINIKKLAINDGFDSAEDFFAYFNKDFTGNIVHWTDLKY